MDMLLDDAIHYAKRNSTGAKNIVKTLLNKNREIPVADLINQGIKVFIPH